MRVLENRSVFLMRILPKVRTLPGCPATSGAEIENILYVLPLFLPQNVLFRNEKRRIDPLPCLRKNTYFSKIFDKIRHTSNLCMQVLKLSDNEAANETRQKGQLNV